MSKKRVAELVDIERDINPYDVVALYAGVGSGKNTFIEGYHSETENVIGLAENHRVLLITSRAEKVKETLKHTEQQNVKFVKYLDDDINLIFNYDENIICTYAHVAKYIKNNFILGNNNTYFWREFDFIVIDECHSLITDSTFADSSFYIAKMLEYIHTKETNKKPKIIFMSGTPEPVSEYLETFNPHIINLFDQAINLKPKNFQLITSKQSNAKLREFIRTGKTVVYFKNRLNNLNGFIDGIVKGEDIFPDEETKNKSYSSHPKLSEKQYKSKMAVSVSANTINKNIGETYPEIAENILQWDTEHAEKETIPSHIRLLITNAKSKEGINILSNVDYVFIESHILSDIIQMCGRFRNIDKINTVYLIYDAKQFNFIQKYNNEEEYQTVFALEKIKEYYKKITSSNEQCSKAFNAYNVPEIKGFIEYIENTSQFIKYNPFSNEFEKNILLSIAIKYLNKSKQMYKSNMRYYNESQRFYDNEFTSYFCNDSRLHKDVLPNPFNAFKARLYTLGYDIDTYVFSGTDEQFLLEAATKIMKQFYFIDNNKYTKYLQPLLENVFGCKKQPLTKSHNKSAKFKIIKIEEGEDDTI